jgi:HSP20 family protein
MAIVRWSPFRELVSLQDEMNKVFDEFFTRRTGERADLGLWAPALDISETDNEIVVKADLPGVKKEDVSISITNNILVIKGEKKREVEENKENFHRVERVYGSFHRSIELPTAVQTDKVNASYQNGVLTIVLPKSEEAKPKEIEIKVK